MTDMIICGLSMEMEMAREMGTIGQCKSCLYLNGNRCDKKGLLKKHRSNCKDWVVDHR